MSLSRLQEISLRERETVRRSWRLAGGRVALDPNKSVRADIEIKEGRVTRIISPSGPADGDAASIVDASGLLVLPGLINAHDHLEFALFPCLGHGPYPSARAWAEDIHHPDESPIREHLAVPKEKRLVWGAIRNLLSGVTTVAHHNPYEAVFESGFPVRVVRDYGWAHSPALTSDLKERFEAAAPDHPFLIHLGEGVDEESLNEIHQLDGIGVLGPRTVLIHCVALGFDELKLVESRGASIVCCPSSNLFLFGRTVARELWDSAIPVALGTDSSLTNDRGLLDELRAAQYEAGLLPQRLYEMVTSRAAGVLRLHGGEGSISEGGVADVFLIPDHGASPCESLLRATAPDVRMVLIAGALKLLTENAIHRLDDLPANLNAFDVAGRCVYLAGSRVDRENVSLPGYGDIRPAPKGS